MVDELLLHYKGKILSPAEVKALPEGTYVREHHRDRYGEHRWTDGQVMTTASGRKMRFCFRHDSPCPIKSTKGHFYTLSPDGFGVD